MFIFFFFNDTATTEIYTLSLHDALPILLWVEQPHVQRATPDGRLQRRRRALRNHLAVVDDRDALGDRKEHTSELQSRQYLVCRLLLEKKKKQDYDEQSYSQESVVTHFGD